MGWGGEVGFGKVGCEGSKPCFLNTNKRQFQWKLGILRYAFHGS